MGLYILDKLIGGMYLGKIVKTTMIEMIENGDLHPDIQVQKEMFELDSEFLSMMESTDVQDLTKVVKRYCQFEVSQDEAKKIQKLCQAVSERSAVLVACSVAAVAIKIFENSRVSKIACGGDGSVFHKHPSYKKKLGIFTNEIIRSYFDFHDTW